MDKYQVRDSFITARDTIFREMFWQPYTKVASLIANNKRMNQLARFESIHEQIIYLTTKRFLFSVSNLLDLINICNDEVWQLINQYDMDFDKMDPLALGNYLHIYAAKLGDDFFDIYQLEKALDHLNMSLSYFDQTDFDDRKIFVRFYLAELLYKYGKYDEALELCKNALEILHNSTQLTEQRISNLNMRINAVLLMIRSQLEIPTDLQATAEQLRREFFGVPISYHFFNNNFIELIEYYLSINDQGSARELAEKYLEVQGEINIDLSNASLPTNILYESQPFYYYMVSNIIDLKTQDIKIQWNAFERLDGLLKIRYSPPQLRSKILTYQLEFLLNLYRGFATDHYYQGFLNKVEQQIEIGRTHKSSITCSRGYYFLIISLRII